MNAVQKADPRARARSLWLVVIVMILGVLCVGFIDSRRADLSTWVVANSDALASQPVATALVTSAIFAPVIVFSLYFIATGRKIINARRFPPPGMKVIRDTRILEGRAAVVRGRLLYALAVGLLVAVVACTFLAFSLVMEVARAT